MSGVLSESIGAKEIGPLFNVSIMTQVDEVTSDKHMKMSLIELVEALARVADKVI